MAMLRILCVVAVVLLASIYVTAEKFVICYYGSWATYRPGLGKFDVANMNPHLCTHAVYTFAGLNDQGMIVATDPWLDLPDDWGRNNYGAFNALKQQNPRLKTLLAVGGWNLGAAKFSVLAASPVLRRNFITSAIKMIQDHGFDGLDVDWEYPNRRDTVYGEADVNNYTELLRQLREEFDKYGLLLSAAVSPVRDTASVSYDIPAISRYLDLINLMTYDLYGPWDPVTGHNAAMHMGEGDEGQNKDELYTVDVALQYWLDEGAPPEKLSIGVPFYGRTFILSEPSNNGVRAPSSGAGIAGPYTATDGVLGYNEFCTRLQTEPWALKYDESAKVPYASSGQDWLSYDNVDSIVGKVQFALDKGIAGIMIWSIETDDFHNVCGGGDFPLLRAVNRALGRSGSGVSAEITASSDSNSAGTTKSEISIQSASACKEEGFAPNPEDCSSFYMCVKNRDVSMQAWKFQCPDDLVWDQDNSMCNYAELVQCYTHK